MKKIRFTMKLIALLFICALSASSCCSTKKTQVTVKETPIKETQIIEKKATVTNGKLIGTTTIIKNTPEVPETPVTPETPETPATLEIPVTPEVAITTPETVVKPVVTTPIATKVDVTPQNNSLTHEAWNTLLVQHVTKDGNVDYTAFKNNRSKLKKYITHLSENLPTDEDSKKAKLAYWMNAYNAMTVDLIVRNLPIKSIKDIKKPWDQRLWKLGTKWYNLNEIEHQILRKMGDPRIHFGINCASFSCPPILNKAFTEANTEQLLDKLSIQFINDTKRNTISENAIEISNIFKWFSKDFKQQGSVIDYLNQYSTIKISEGTKVKYKDYDWTLNQ